LKILQDVLSESLLNDEGKAFSVVMQGMDYGLPWL
jgi:hypothetical protein